MPYTPRTRYRPEKPDPAATIAGMPRQTEKAFTAQVAQLARLAGFLSYHTWNSLHSARGFPDLVLVRDRGDDTTRVIFVELKTDTGRVSPDQEEWLGKLIRCPGIETYLWRPQDWPDIERILGRERQ